MEENEEEEVDVVDAVFYGLVVQVGRIGRRRPKMKGKNEKEDKGVKRGDLGIEKMFVKGVATPSLV